MVSLFWRNYRYMKKDTKANRIRQLRLDAKLTQQQVASYVGVSRVAVAKWESGDTKDLKQENLFRLADLLKINERELVRGGPGGPSTPPKPAPKTNVEQLPKRRDKRIEEAIQLMEATDDRGRDIALAGLKGALAGYVTKAKRNPASSSSSRNSPPGDVKPTARQ